MISESTRVFAYSFVVASTIVLVAGCGEGGQPGPPEVPAAKGTQVQSAPRAPEQELPVSVPTPDSPDTFHPQAQPEQSADTAPMERAYDDSSVDIQSKMIELRKSILNAGELVVEEPRDLLVGSPRQQFGAFNSVPHLFTTITREKVTTSDVFPVMGRFADLIWPGSIVRGRSLESGALTPVVLPRRSGTVTVTNLTKQGGAGSSIPIYSFSMEKPSLASVLLGIQGAVTQQMTTTAAADFTYSSSEFHSVDQALQIIGVSRNWLNRTLMTAIESSFSPGKSNFVVRYVQAYYTASFDAPEAPETVFGASTDLELARMAFVADDGQADPPGFISSVTYGRDLYLIVSSSESASNVKNALDAAFRPEFINGAAALNPSQEAILRSATITPLVFGGSAATSSLTVSSQDAFRGYIRSGLEFSPSSPGAPIFWQMRWLRSNKPSQISLSSQYNVTTSAPIGMSQIRVKFLTTEDNKDRVEPVYVKTLLGGQVMTDAKLGENEDWDEGTSREFTFNPSSIKSSDCLNSGRIQLQVTKHPHGSRHGKGWEVQIAVEGVLEDGRVVTLMPLTGSMEFGDASDHNKVFNLECRY